MKPKSTKFIGYSIILSAFLHAAFFIFLFVIYKPEPNSVNRITHLQIQQIPTERTLRKIKQQRSLAPKYVPVINKQLNMSANPINISVSPTITKLPASTPLTHQNPITPIRNYSLPTPHTLEKKGTDLNSTTPQVVQGIGTATKTSIKQPHRIYRGTKQQPDLHPLTDILPEFVDLPLPTAILERIGQHIVANRSSNDVDVVFIIDASGSMKDNINTVRNHLHIMTEKFQKVGIDFTLGIVLFRDHATYSILGWDFEVTPQTRSVKKIKNVLSRVKCTGGEKALDALIRAADEVKYRQNADVHFLLITDEYVSGNYSAKDVLNKMHEAQIKVDVIGLDEPFQKYITRRTGGIWFPISSLGDY